MRCHSRREMGDFRRKFTNYSNCRVGGGAREGREGGRVKWNSKREETEYIIFVIQRK